jgi:hypothetical protein
MLAVKGDDKVPRYELPFLPTYRQQATLVVHVHRPGDRAV